jgi:hydroxymethylglutaryl-CoA synthase
MSFGIEAASYYVPSLYLEIKDLAEKRGIEPAKLEKGLGLHKMGFPDVHEDAATFAAEALLRLIKDYDINPKEISRIYLGTESALDAAKPTASYAMQMVEKVLEEEFGERVFRNCDVVDMTFACIGAVDALHNSLDFVRSNPDKKAVVIASDYAKYELASSGEYTQGGGAVAVLVSSKPDLMEIENNWGVATESVFDFLSRDVIIKKKILPMLLRISRTALKSLQMNLFLTDNIPISVTRTESEKHITIIKKLQELISLIKTGNILFSTFLMPFMGKESSRKSTVWRTDFPMRLLKNRKLLQNPRIIFSSSTIKLKSLKEPLRNRKYVYGFYFYGLFSAMQTSFNENEDLSGPK